MVFTGLISSEATIRMGVASTTNPFLEAVDVGWLIFVAVKILKDLGFLSSGVMCNGS
jgi:hypothetical protein